MFFVLVPVWFVAWLAGKVFPPLLMVLFVVAASLLGAGIVHWRFVVWRRQAQAELVEALVDMPVYLTSEMWHLATENGLISPDVLADAYRKRAAARRAEELDR
jgi:hypothetical protein